MKEVKIGPYTTTWAEHLAWCKVRALEYVERGDMLNAVASMASDLRKHPEAPGPVVLATLTVAASRGPQDAGTVRRWIEGWN